MNFFSFLNPYRKKTLLRLSIGGIYVWFGALKYFASVNEIETFSTEIIHLLCFRLIPEEVCYLLLAHFEVLIGLLLIANIYIRSTIKITLIHLAGTFSPLILQPEVLFNVNPFVMTMIGQYVMKNIIIICALLCIYPENTVDIPYAKRTINSQKSKI